MRPEVTAVTPADRTGPAPVLAFERFGFTYTHGRQPALDGVDLRIEPGEFVLMAGRSGSGKSTLLRAGCGLVPHFHGGELAGRVLVNGRDTAAHGPGDLADTVGYVAQDPEAQIVSTTVAAELDLPLRFRGIPITQRARAVEEVALALNIAGLLERPVNGLSGGETQRVALAAALVTRPPLVMLDEPTSQLDPVAGDELIWLLRRLNREWGVAILLAEHRLERCLTVADRVLCVDRARIAFDGSPEGFLDWTRRDGSPLLPPLGRLFDRAGLEPLPVGVREARRTLAGLAAAGERSGTLDVTEEQPQPVREAGMNPPALTARSLWVELESEQGARDVLRGIDLKIGPGSTVALMGRNGAGKSTLLKTAAGVLKPVHGKVDIPGGVALLSQSPGDYLVRDRVGDEIYGPEGEAALAAVGLDVDPDADPRDLSGGERQRLALAIVLAGRIEAGRVPGVVALDEPTRGVDPELKQELAGLVRDLATSGSAVLVATHDVEFAAGFADRVVLLGDGEVIADGPMREVLSGGWYFATEVSRAVDRPGVVTVDDGLDWIEAVRP